MTLDDALTDVRIAFLQVEFAIKLLSYCEQGDIDPAVLDTHQVVLLEQGNLGFPAGNFSAREDIIRAASVAVSLALAGSALALDKAWETAGIPRDPSSPDGAVRLRTLVHMVRCAYAHGVADPRWEVRGNYRQVLEVDLPTAPLRLDLRALDSQSFDFVQLGGHAKWFEIRDQSIIALTESNSVASTRPKSAPKRLAIASDVLEVRSSSPRGHPAITQPDMAVLFDLLDGWRHLPSYRLEPRADAMFGLFMPDALDRHLAPRGITVNPLLIPEFPLGQDDTRRSDKADFFAVSRDRRHAFLVELKTDMNSLRDTQEDYLHRAVERGMASLLCDIRSMAKTKNSRARRKYFHLLKAVAELELMILPVELEDRIYDSSQGVYDCIDRIRLPSALPDIEVIHVLPAAVKGMDCIDFEGFAAVVEEHGKIGERFAASLRNWSAIKAGDRWPDTAPAK